LSNKTQPIFSTVLKLLNQTVVIKIMNELKLIVFDGVCMLCNGTVDFLLRFDRKKQFRYVALQSDAGKMVQQKFNIPKETDSVLLLLNNQVFTASEAVIKIASLLPFPWKMVVIFRIIPKKFRDKMYNRIARNRYRWFGTKEFCRIPSPEEKMYFPEKEDLDD